MLKSALLCAVAFSALVAGPAARAQDVPPSPEAVRTPHYGTWGFDLGGRDLATPPGKNFFRYADGRDVDRMTIPPDRSTYGAFVALAELSEAREHAILIQAAATAPEQPATPDGKIGAYYKAFMDEARIEALGTRPLAHDLDAIRAVRDKAQMARLMGLSGKGYLRSIFSFGIGADEKDPNRYVVGVGQGGLGLPDRDYYLTAQFAPQKAKYQDYVARMLMLIGWPDPAANAAAVVAMETQIAQASWTKAEQRNPDKTYNPFTVADLPKLAPSFAWTPFLQSADLGGVQRVIVAENTAVPKILAIYEQTPLETLKAWEAFNLADSAAPVLPRAFVQARFEFRNKTLQGQPELQARWKRGVEQVDEGMGEALGQVYVARYFPPESKAKMQALIGDLKAAFAARIERLDWMSPATKAEALTKLQRFTVKIGYPDKFRDYSALTIEADDAYGNAERATAFDWRRQVRRINGPVDRTEWGMTPQTVNAYNNPVFNEVVFPAAILQPPFFDPKADPAINYGAIGGVIGHEMTHGFDDEGRKYDATGTLRDWWTPADATQFDARAARLGVQYSAFEVLPGAHVNGALTMGENIADSGGINLALDAYHASLHGRPAPVIDGLTGDQRVFLGWAQVWRAKVRDDAARQRLVSDPHSPPEARVDLPLRNVDAWYSAFGVKPGDAAYLAPADRVHIW